MEPTMTIQTLAGEARKQFEQRTRTTTGETYWAHGEADRYPNEDWVQDMIRAAHGDYMPDDQRYSMIVDALDAIADNVFGFDLEFSVEPPTYTSDLTAWLNSSNSRVGYLTDALQEWGADCDGFQLLGRAWLQEFHEVLASVKDSLQDRLIELETA